MNAILDILLICHLMDCVFYSSSYNYSYDYHYYQHCLHFYAYYGYYCDGNYE